MSEITKALAAAAVLTFAPAAVAQPYGGADLARYDAARATTLGEQLVLCDLASYFATRPDLDAHRIYIRRDNYRYDPAFPQAITRGGIWHDEDLERAYLRHRRAGRVSGMENQHVRGQLGPEMERSFRVMGVREQRFFQDQDRFCRNLVRQSWADNRR